MERLTLKDLHDMLNFVNTERSYDKPNYIVSFMFQRFIVSASKDQIVKEIKMRELKQNNKLGKLIYGL